MVCNYNKLSDFVENKLDIDSRLEILEHLEQCSHCFDEVYKLKKMRDGRHFIYKELDIDIEEDIEEIAV